MTETILAKSQPWLKQKIFLWGIALPVMALLMAPAAQARAGLQVTGTVRHWNGDRIDLETRDGKTQKVAVNAETERLVEIREGSPVTVEYRRKVGGFVIAERVRAAEEGEADGTAQAAGPKIGSLTGEVVSWNDSALVLRSAEGETTLFLSPETEYLVPSLDPGTLVTVEYREGADRARLATRVLAAPEADARAASPQNRRP